MNKYVLLLFCFFASFASTVFAESDSQYVSKISPLSASTREQILEYTWHPGCPISPDDLVEINVTYWGFDQQSHTGLLIMNKSVANDIVSIFKILYDNKFPIVKMLPIENYRGDEKLAMGDNDTYGFHCRPMTSNHGLYSLHSYGQAIDINPVLNPYSELDIVLPAEGKKYLDRTVVVPGMILKDSVVDRAFKSYGWQWGGDWQFIKDYQHFQKSD